MEMMDHLESMMEIPFKNGPSIRIKTIRSEFLRIKTIRREFFS